MTSCLEAMGWEFGYFEKKSVGDKMTNWEPAADRRLWALSDPQLSNQAKMRKKYCWVNIAVFPRLQLISHTQQPTSTLSRIKCERYIFIKKCVRSFIGVRHYCWPCFRSYLYLYVLSNINSLTCFLIDVEGSILITGAKVVKKPSFRFLFNQLLPLFIKSSFFN